MSAYFTIKNKKKMLGKRVNIVNTLLQICNKDTKIINIWLFVRSIGYVQRSSRSMYGLFLQIQNPHIYTTSYSLFFKSSSCYKLQLFSAVQPV